MSRYKHQLARAQEQLETQKRKTEEVDVTAAQERHRLEGTISTLRDDISTFITQRDEARAKLASESEEITE